MKKAVIFLLNMKSKTKRQKRSFELILSGLKKINPN